jgi:predicted transcriptional regulator
MSALTYSDSTGTEACQRADDRNRVYDHLKSHPRANVKEIAHALKVPRFLVMTELLYLSHHGIVRFEAVAHD